MDRFNTEREEHPAFNLTSPWWVIQTPAAIDQSPPSNWRLRTCLVAILFALSTGVFAACQAGTSDSDWPWVSATFTRDIPGRFSVLFRWDSEQFGLLDPNSGETLVLRPHDLKVGVTQGPSLPVTKHAVPGAILQDSVVRLASGDFYWMSRAAPFVSVHDSTGQRLSEWRTPCWPWSMESWGTDGVVIYGTSCTHPEAGAYYFDRNGVQRKFEPSWMVPTKKGDPLPAALTLSLEKDRRADFMIFLPFVRIAQRGSVITRRVDSCPAVPNVMRQHFIDEERRAGLPQPFGNGLTGKWSDDSPFFLQASDASATRMFAVANGNVLFGLTSDGQLRCWRIPPAQLDRRERSLVNGVQAVSTHLAILNTTAKVAELRVWRF